MGAGVHLYVSSSNVLLSSCHDWAVTQSLPMFHTDPRRRCACVCGGGEGFGWQANARRPGCWSAHATEPGEVHHQLLHALFGCNLLVQSIPLPAACLEPWLRPGCVYNLEPDGRQDHYPLMLTREADGIRKPTAWGSLSFGLTGQPKDQPILLIVTASSL
jgi:hypothetical protein